MLQAPSSWITVFFRRILKSAWKKTAQLSRKEFTTSNFQAPFLNVFHGALHNFWPYFIHFSWNQQLAVRWHLLAQWFSGPHFLFFGRQNHPTDWMKPLQLRVPTKFHDDKRSHPDSNLVICPIDTVDGRNPAYQLRLVVYPIIYRVLYIPGFAGFLPSTVRRLQQAVASDFGSQILASQWLLKRGLVKS